MDVRDVTHATLLRRRATILYEMSIADIFALAFGGGGERESRSHGRIGQDLSLDVAGSFDLELGGLVSKSLDEDPQIPCRDTLQRDREGLVLSRCCSQAVCGDFASCSLAKMTLSVASTSSLVVLPVRVSTNSIAGSESHPATHTLRWRRSGFSSFWML